MADRYTLEGDVYVADSYGKIATEPLSGINLGNSIYSKTKKGLFFIGSVRDQEGLEEIEGFNGWIKVRILHYCSDEPCFINRLSG